MAELKILATYHPSPELTTDFNHECWQQAQPLTINRNWQGKPAPTELHTTARVLWSEKEILLGFECGYTELDVDEEFNLNEERHALWDRDVCEAFISSPIEPHDKYYREFEAAPTGQWCDLLVELAPSGARMWHDWEWKSGMRTVAEILSAEKIWRVVMAIPFTAFGCAPKIGDVWHANLFRISRLNGERQYLTYSPTLTEQPNFHVTESFVVLQF
ncbi:MAG: carbohydrate-binding family 9-like protein [Acidobacteria bacterium]|nr:carbohydrate-binding family 9-like protein [Acidobacteriota bacterium]